MPTCLLNLALEVVIYLILPLINDYIVALSVYEFHFHNILTVSLLVNTGWSMKT